MTTPDPVALLIRCLGRLPGIGRRSAERIAMHLAAARGPEIRDLVAALQQVDAEVCSCQRCGGLTVRAQDPCPICSDPRRDPQLVCVVQDPADIALLERARAHTGLYHALCGKLSPMQGQGPRDLRLQNLHRRVREDQVRELILAMNSDVEGDATARFIQESFAGAPIRITRLAYGLPAGSGIGYSDPVTLARALAGRIPYTPESAE